MALAPVPPGAVGAAPMVKRVAPPVAGAAMLDTLKAEAGCCACPNPEVLVFPNPPGVAGCGRLMFTPTGDAV